jgi:hypothetical protein
MNFYREDAHMLRHIMANRKLCVAVVAAILGLAVGSGTQLRASDILTDLSSTVQVYSQSDAGIGSWSVNGVNELSREWFWYSTGAVGSANPEKSIDTLSCTLDSPSDTNANPGYDTLNQEFTKSGQFKVDLAYVLTGSNGTGSELSLQISITNLGSQALNFHWYQLGNFGLGGSSGLDVAQAGVNGHGYYITASEQNGGLSVVTSLNPGANRAQVNLHPTVYNLLTGTQGSNLNNSAGPIGPGNIDSAFQWDLTIPSNGTTSILETQSMSLTVVPEPATLCLLALGGLALLRRKN